MTRASIAARVGVIADTLTAVSCHLLCLTLLCPRLCQCFKPNVILRFAFPLPDQVHGFQIRQISRLSDHLASPLMKPFTECSP
jgi:hypothetical protein